MTYLKSIGRHFYRGVECLFIFPAIARKGRLFRLLVEELRLRFREHSYVTKVTLAYHPWRGYSPFEDHGIWWEAPMGIIFWHGPRPAFVMSFELRFGALCIRQLQGVAGARIPRELADWPRRLVKACIACGDREGLESVRLYRADQSHFYRYPDFDLDDDEVTEEMLKKHRMRMRRRYDGTARKLGLRFRERWAEWTCSRGAPAR